MTRERIREPMNRRSRRTRHALLTAARQILEEAGFESLTLAGVAERAGATRMTAYLHFENRGQLIVALFDHNAETEGLAESMARVWAAPDALSALDEWAAHLARYHPKLIPIDRAIDDARRLDADVAALRERVVAAKLKNCRRLARWLADEEVLRPPWNRQSAADMLFALISTDMIEALLLERQWSTKRLTTHLAMMFRSTFASTNPTPAKA